MPNLKAFPHILQSFFPALKTGALCTDLHRMMGFFLLDLQSLKQPFYLLKRDLFYFIRCPRPLVNILVSGNLDSGILETDIPEEGNSLIGLFTTYQVVRYCQAQSRFAVL